MIDLELIFKYKKPNFSRLKDYGFSFSDTGQEYRASIMDGQFDISVTVTPDGGVDYTVIDNSFGEEYYPVKTEVMSGGFIGAVRNGCEAVLRDISEKCFDVETLKAEQTRRVIEFIENSFCSKPEFLWEDTPDCAAIRRNDNGKWFAVIMTVGEEKLGLSGHGRLEIMNLKAEPDKIKNLLVRDGYYPAFHMNKKHWFTVALDGSIEDESLFEHIKESRALVAPKRRKKEEKMVEVVAALVWDNGKFMICRRPPHKARGLLWEFVGGKVEEGETREEALMREGREELDIALEVGGEFMSVVHKYPDITVHLTLFNALIIDGEPKLIEHIGLEWITPGEIDRYDFCPADAEILAEIKKRYENKEEWV